jgi:hypothetical protein
MILQIAGGIVTGTAHQHKLGSKSGVGIKAISISGESVTENDITTMKKADKMKFQVSWYSNDKTIGFLGKKDFDSLPEMIDYLIDFYPDKEWSKNDYGYYKIFADARTDRSWQLPPVAIDIIEELVSKYRRDVGELENREYQRSMQSPQAAKDFGRIL